MKEQTYHLRKKKNSSSKITAGDYPLLSCPENGNSPAVEETRWPSQKMRKVNS